MKRKNLIREERLWKYKSYNCIQAYYISIFIDKYSTIVNLDFLKILHYTQFPHRKDNAKEKHNKILNIFTDDITFQNIEEFSHSKANK